MCAGSTEIGEIQSDRMTEVSSGHSRLYRAIEGPNKLRAVIVQEE